MKLIKIKSMKMIKNIIGGLAGAVALNILHETIKRFEYDAPRVDLVGEEALNKILEKFAAQPISGNQLFTATLAADVFSNAIYYSLIGIGKDKNLLLRGIIYGGAAGIGALKLTKPIGLSDAPINRNDKTKLLTVGYYLVGGLITALTIKSLRS